jgi:hypothetical protein
MPPRTDVQTKGYSPPPPPAFRRHVLLLACATKPGRTLRLPTKRPHRSLFVVISPQSESLVGRVPLHVQLACGVAGWSVRWPARTSALRPRPAGHPRPGLQWQGRQQRAQLLRKYQNSRLRRRVGLPRAPADLWLRCSRSRPGALHANARAHLRSGTRMRTRTRAPVRATPGQSFRFPSPASVHCGRHMRRPPASAPLLVHAPPPPPPPPPEAEELINDSEPQLPSMPAPRSQGRSAAPVGLPPLEPVALAPPHGPALAVRTSASSASDQGAGRGSRASRARQLLACGRVRLRAARQPPLALRWRARSRIPRHRRSRRLGLRRPPLATPPAAPHVASTCRR